MKKMRYDEYGNELNLEPIFPDDAHFIEGYPDQSPEELAEIYIDPYEDELEYYDYISDDKE